LLTATSGTSRHLAATKHFRCFRIEADIDRRAIPAGPVENDPTATCAFVFCRDAQRRSEW
jgi:hypothetical protein